MDLLKPRMYNFFNTVTPRNVVTETPVLTTSTHKRTFSAALFIINTTDNVNDCNSGDG